MEQNPRRLRLAALVALVLVLAGTGLWLQKAGRIDSHIVVEKIGAMGIWAVPAFLIVCIVGELLHLPGMLFVVVAQLVFGKTQGFFVAYLGAFLGVAVAFAVARLARGRGESPKPIRLRFEWANRFLQRLDTHPIGTIVVLRLVFWISPPLNYALGWSRVRARDYLIASAIGLVLPIAVVSFVLTRFQ